MTFNIRWDGLDQDAHSWEERKLDVTTLLQKYGPDIIALQESSSRQTQYLKESLSGYESFSLLHEIGRYNSILLRTERFDLAAKGSFVLVGDSSSSGATRGCTWVRLIEIASGRGFYVYNLHLDGRSAKSRKSSVVRLMKKISNREFNAPFLVMGDFNAVETSDSISYLKGEIPLQDQTGQLRLNPIPLKDAVRKVFPDAKSLGTAHSFSGNPDGPRIDYIFVSDGITVRSAFIVHDNTNGRFPSDHFPIIADLELVK